MKRGFELLITRSLRDKVDIDFLEKKYAITLPPLLRLFIKTFKIGTELMYFDKFYSEIDKDYFECSFIHTELGQDEIMFTGFLSIEDALELRKNIYDLDDDIIINGYIPIGQTSSNASILIGTKDSDTDMLILDSDRIGRFKKLNVNIFEFIQSITLKEVNQDFMRGGVRHEQLYKNWEEDFWRIKT